MPRHIRVCHVYTKYEQNRLLDVLISVPSIIGSNVTSVSAARLPCSHVTNVIGILQSIEES